MENKRVIRDGSAECYQRIHAIKELIKGELTKELVYRWSLEDLRNLQKGFRDHKVLLLQKAANGYDRWFSLDGVGRKNPLSNYDFWDNPQKRKGLEGLFKVLQLAGETESGEIQHSAIKHLEELIAGASQLKQGLHDKHKAPQARRILAPAHI